MEIAMLTAESGMDSREIARITGKRHDHVIRDIEDQLGTPGVIEGGLPRFGDTYASEQNGQRYRCYRLPKRECIILASGYDVVLRAKIIDRWAELEAKIPQAPANMIEALTLALEQAKTIESQSRQLAIAGPKAAAQDLLAGAGGEFGIREAGKQVGMGQKAFVAFLVAKKIMYRLGGDLTPLQEHIDAGRFAVSTGTAIHGEDAHAWRQAKFTAKGIAWIAEKISGSNAPACPAAKGWSTPAPRKAPKAAPPHPPAAPGPPRTSQAGRRRPRNP